MRLDAMMLMIGLAACSDAQTVSASESYSAFLMEDGKTWCAYKSLSEFQTDVTNQQPNESARVAYSANVISEVTYQTEAESGDWIVVDKYTPVVGGATVRRANLLAQLRLQVIQEAAIQGDKVGPFRVVDVSTLGSDKKAELPPNVDFPPVPVFTNLSAHPFVRVVGEMRSKSLGKLCKKTD